MAEKKKNTVTVMLGDKASSFTDIDQNVTLAGKQVKEVQKTDRVRAAIKGGALKELDAEEAKKATAEFEKIQSEGEEAGAADTKAHLDKQNARQAAKGKSTPAKKTAAKSADKPADTEPPAPANDMRAADADTANTGADADKGDTSKK